MKYSRAALTVVMGQILRDSIQSCSALNQCGVTKLQYENRWDSHFIKKDVFHMGNIHMNTHVQTLMMRDETKYGNEIDLSQR